MAYDVCVPVRQLPAASGQPCSQPLEEASLSLNEAEAVLDPVADIDGFLLGCLVDASTGMILAAHKDQDDISLPTGRRVRQILPMCFRCSRASFVRTVSRT